MSAPAIPPSAYAARRTRLAAAAADAGLDGVLVWSRGSGASGDRHADVAYLTGLFNPTVQVEDTAAWAGVGHAALVLRCDGVAIALSTVLPPQGAPDGLERWSAADLPAAVARAIEQLDVGGERLGLVGEAALLRRDALGIERALGRPLPLPAADELLWRLRMRKDAEEIALLRRAADVGTRWVEAMLAAAEPGRTEADVVAAGLGVLAAGGGRPYDVAIRSGPFAGDYWGYEVPMWDTRRPLAAGDLLHVDAWGPVAGYYTDLARTVVVGREPTEAQSELIEGAIACVEAMVAQIRPGRLVGELHAAGSAWLAEHGLQVPAGSPFGHGLGLAVEPPWILDGEPTRLEPGMALAVEVFLAAGPAHGANFEQNVLVTEHGCELLSANLPTRRPR
jgi:Xaa-Pro aminopeptidase